MKDYIKSIEAKLNDIEYILLAVITSILIKIPLQVLIYLYEKYGGNLSSYFNGESMISLLISGCFLGPILESFFIFFLIWMLKNKFHVNRKSHLLLTTSVIFASLHYYSLVYIIVIFPSCFIIVYSYLCYKPKKLSSFTVMLWVHIISNTTVILLSLF
jgi:hypothetical protein